MNFKTITMPEMANYLSDFLTELPTGIFNKKITSTGATTLVMENKQDVIILCPTKGLIDNKIKQYPNKRCNYEFFKLDGDVNTSDVIKYINRCNGKQPVKLICTYDSLHKLLGISNIYKNYALIVDEFQELLKLTGDRELRAILILSEFTKFTKYTFLSATPIKEKHLPIQLEALDYYELVIPNIEKIKVVGQQTNKPFSMVVDIIKNFKVKNEIVIDGKSCKHLYIYINTVANIANIIKASGITQNDCNIFCGDYLVNELKLSKVSCEIGELLTETQLNEHPEYEAPIHFITSKGFQGCDIYSNDGVAIYVTNCNIKSTLSGMGTLQQVSGRIRTKSNPFNGIIYHIYNINNSVLTFDEYLKEQQIRINKSLVIINGWHTVPQEFKDSVLHELDDADIHDITYYHYHIKETDTMLLNDLRIVADQDNHEVENKIYTDGIEVRKAYNSQGLEDYSNYYLKLESVLKNIIQHKTFKEYCIAYNESITTPFYIGEPFFGCSDITIKRIKKAFKELGYKKIVELKYHQSSILKQTKDVSDITFNTYAVIKAMYKAFTVGERYSKPFIKDSIQTIFNGLGIEKKATATTINDYFESKDCKLVNRENGILIVRKLNTIK